MPSNYSGNPSNVTTPLSRGIISCASGSGGLVLVGTSTSHLFSTYDYVSISGVVGTTEANTEAEITVVDATTFLLNGVPFVNAYSSGGTAQDISLTPYFSMPNDGEYGTVAQIEASIQCIADRTQFLKAYMRGLATVKAFTASTTYRVPLGTTHIECRGWGAGGAGGAGHDGAATNHYNACGGGGGGGAVATVQGKAVTPGEILTITIGAGAVGSDGGDTTVVGLSGTTTFRGGGQGAGGDLDADISYSVAQGGSPTRGVTGQSASVTTIFLGIGLTFNSTPSAGGCGVTRNLTGCLGNASPQGWNGGNPGSAGANPADPTYAGGSAAGGGGAGPGGLGGGGGSGGAGSSTGTGNPGSPGTAGAANTGSGGGGGGGGGAGTSGTAAGGTGAAGGSGYLEIILTG